MSMVTHDTECPYWDQVSLNDTNQTSLSFPPFSLPPPPSLKPTLWGLGWWSEYVNPYIPTQTHDKNQWPYAITRLRAHCMCGLVSDLVIFTFRWVWSHMTLNVLTETRCHYTIQTKPLSPSPSSPPPPNRPSGVWGDEVSMLTHTYPHKPMTKIKVTICNQQAESPLYVWSGVWSGDLQNNLEKDGHTWHWMSLLRPGVTKQYKPNLSLPPSLLLLPHPPDPLGWWSEYVNPYIPTQTHDKNQSDHMQSTGWEPTLCVVWCLIWWFAK